MIAAGKISTILSAEHIFPDSVKINLHKNETKTDLIADLNHRVLVLEEEILEDNRIAYYYALNTVRDRWPAGEKTISTNASYAYWYVAHVVNGRWPEGEAIIATSARHAYWYAKNILKGRFILGEPAIAKDVRKKSYERYFGIKI